MAEAALVSTGEQCQRGRVEGWSWGDLEGIDTASYLDQYVGEASSATYNSFVASSPDPFYVSASSPDFYVASSPASAPMTAVQTPRSDGGLDHSYISELPESRDTPEPRQSLDSPGSLESPGNLESPGGFEYTSFTDRICALSKQAAVQTNREDRVSAPISSLSSLSPLSPSPLSSLSSPSPLSLSPLSSLSSPSPLSLSPLSPSPLSSLPSLPSLELGAVDRKPFQLYTPASQIGTRPSQLGHHAPCESSPQYDTPVPSPSGPRFPVFSTHRARTPVQRAQPSRPRCLTPDSPCPSRPAPVTPCPAEHDSLPTSLPASYLGLATSTSLSTTSDAYITVPKVQMMEWTDKVDTLISSSERRFRELHEAILDIRSEMQRSQVRRAEMQQLDMRQAETQQPTQHGRDELFSLLEKGLNEIKASLAMVSLAPALEPVIPPRIAEAPLVHSDGTKEHSVQAPIVRSVSSPQPLDHGESEPSSDNETRGDETQGDNRMNEPTSDDASIRAEPGGDEEIPAMEHLPPVDWSFLSVPLCRDAGGMPIAGPSRSATGVGRASDASDDAAGENELESMVSTSQLSSGVESLPSSCRSSVEPSARPPRPPPQWTLLPISDRTFRARKRSVDYVHHPMDSACKRAKKNFTISKWELEQLASAKSYFSVAMAERGYNLRGLGGKQMTPALLRSNGLRNGPPDKWPKRAVIPSQSG